MSAETQVKPTSHPADAVQSGRIHQPPSTPETLSFQRCSWCASPVFPARLLCPVCGSAELTCEQSRGTGRVHNNRGHRNSDTQQTALTVELDEGIRIMAVVEGVAFNSVDVGARVRFHGMRTGPDPLPVFDVLRFTEPDVGDAPVAPVPQGHARTIRRTTAPEVAAARLHSGPSM
ncbi:Zn-ribbon domain-containing OB-fold protein [Streptacidiphilus carbonis]|uniref:Zn-ribbon domain-containing OB-fold protein n=1 Tax=Streptacidiphilus carbonis TaxID=105422 RepID=UPI0009FEB799